MTNQALARNEVYSIAETEPARLAAYCFDILTRLDEQRVSEETLDELRSFRCATEDNVSLDELDDATVHEVLELCFYGAWSRETAVPKQRMAWSSDAPWVGQEVATALLIQEIFGGTIEYAGDSDDTFQMWNRLDSMVRIYFGHASLPVHGKAITSKGIAELKAKAHITESFKRLRRRLLLHAAACGRAAAEQATQQGWRPPPDDWSEVG